MPSTKFVNVKIKSLPCIEKERMIWIWPGNEPASPSIPSLLPPPGFQIHAEVSFTCISIFVIMVTPSPKFVVHFQQEIGIINEISHITDHQQKKAN